MYMYTRMYIYMYMYMHVFVFMFMYMYLCVYVYIYIYLQPASPHYYRSLLNNQVIQVRVETPSEIRACWFWVFEVTVVRFGHMLSIRKKDRLG